MNRVADVALAIVTVAGITAVFGSSQTARIVTAAGNAFSSSIRASLGN